jgi:histidine ammonia-lyase
MILTIDGKTLTLEQIYNFGYNHDIKVNISKEAWLKVVEGRKVIEKKLENKETIYGVNTGFGLFSTERIDSCHYVELQENLIRSHSVGTGAPLSSSQTRMLMLLRINVLTKGNSGISKETLEKIIKCLNANCLPKVPCQGTVGASGDLAPLSHLALGLMGEGEMLDPCTKTFKNSIDVLNSHNLEPIKLKVKEGLALINGTQFITCIGVEATVRARNIANQADIVSALTLDVLKGTTSAFDAQIHNARPHIGQILVAERLRSLLHSKNNPSEISISHQKCGRVQDSYSMRCIPQVHGIVHDTIKFVEIVLKTECNSATDNPMIFAETGDIISGGNFHGEYPAKVLDYLAIGIHEIASISERRLERLMNPNLNNGLPAFLVKNGGLNSGFMIAHCTAASLVSENKVLTHPSSVDSISTSGGKEDHVSMGGFASRKALQVVEHVEKVIAIELLCACQALDLLRPLTTTKKLEDVYKLVRKYVKPYDKDRYMHKDIEKVTELLRKNMIWEVADI